MSDASSVRKATTLPTATGVNASLIRYNNKRLWWADGGTWQPLAPDTTNWGNNQKVVISPATPTTAGASAALYTVTSPCRLIGLSYMYVTKSSTATLTGNVTLDKPGATAGSGTALTSKLALGGTQVTQQTATIVDPNVVLLPGDIIYNKLSGAANGLAGVTINLTLVPAFPANGVLKVTASNTPVTAVASAFFLADRAYKVVGVSTTYATAAGSGATGAVFKDTGTTAAGGGATTHTAFALDATANTTYWGTLTTTAADLLIAAGDRLSYKVVGTVGSYATPVVTVYLQPI